MEAGGGGGGGAITTPGHVMHVWVTCAYSLHAYSLHPGDPVM